MINISDEKWKSLPKFNDKLNERYGAPGTPSRDAFEARAKAWYYAELLKEERKRQKLTQQQLAEARPNNIVLFFISFLFVYVFTF